jgi:hypothetical protein
VASRRRRSGFSRDGRASHRRRRDVHTPPFSRRPRHRRPPAPVSLTAPSRPRPHPRPPSHPGDGVSVPRRCSRCSLSGRASGAAAGGRCVHVRRRADHALVNDVRADSPGQEAAAQTRHSSHSPPREDCGDSCSQDARDGADPCVISGCGVCGGGRPASHVTADDAGVWWSFAFGWRRKCGCPVVAVSAGRG